ncbi:ATP-dependent DNA helicase Q5 [Pseudocyphellaria aurata]|nr:ATP-dependent DNA helicase Q5 [Pseudocyphellaria aurata]
MDLDIVDNHEGHPDTLQEHPDTLQEHLDSLQEHPDTLQEHPEPLEEHPEPLQEPPETLQEHPETLQEHTETFVNDNRKTESVATFEHLASEPPVQLESAQKNFISRFDQYNPDLWDNVLSLRDISRIQKAQYDEIQQKFVEILKCQPKPWQASVITDLLFHRKDVAVTAGAGSGKSTVYQLVPSLAPGAIVLTFTPTIEFMEDQEKELKLRGVSVISLTSAALKADPEIWSQIDRGLFSVIFASPWVVLAPRSPFWTHTLAGRSGEFFRRLACIAIDEAHLVWGSRKFQNEYIVIDLLRSFFPSVPVLTLSETITKKDLDFVRRSLSLRAPVRLYKESLDRPNVTYSVAEIRKPGYQELDVFLPSPGGSSGIPKTMIFVDNIDEGVTITNYLRSKLSKLLNKDARDIITCPHPHLSTKTRTKFISKFIQGSTRILICADGVSVRLNFRDVQRIGQWRTYEPLTFAALIQRFGQATPDTRGEAIAILFVESRHILPKALEKRTDFAGLDTAVKPGAEKAVHALVSRLPESDTRKRRESGLTSYHRVDRAVLWFINTTGCRRRLILACSMRNAAFSTAQRSRCCDNCMYAEQTDKNTPIYDVLGITARQSMRYFESKEWEEQEVFMEYNRLITKKFNRASEPSWEQCQIIRNALDDWAETTWPNDMATLVFSQALRAKLTKAARRINSVDILRKEILPRYHLDTSILGPHSDELVALLMSLCAGTEVTSKPPVIEWSLSQTQLHNDTSGTPRLPDHGYDQRLKEKAVKSVKATIAKSEEQKRIQARIRRAVVVARFSTGRLLGLFDIDPDLDFEAFMEFSLPTRSWCQNQKDDSENGQDSEDDGEEEESGDDSEDDSTGDSFDHDSVNDEILTNRLREIFDTSYDQGSEGLTELDRRICSRCREILENSYEEDSEYEPDSEDEESGEDSASDSPGEYFDHDSENDG